jgi:hypothetical protein
VRRVDGCCPVKPGMLLKRVHRDLGPLPTSGTLYQSWPRLHAGSVSMRLPGLEITQTVYQNVKVYGL